MIAIWLPLIASGMTCALLVVVAVMAVEDAL